MLETRVLERDTLIQGIHCAAGPVKHKCNKLAKCFLSKDQEIDGLTYRANSELVLSLKTGKVLCGDLATHQKVGDFMCFNSIYFYENGNLKRCTLAIATNIYDIDFSPRSQIFFNDSGKIDFVYPSQKTLVCIEARPHDRVYFDEHGEVKTCSRKDSFLDEYIVNL